ncbi:hypothetical protein COOONC_10597 [Cooperia oncophora]
MCFEANCGAVEDGMTALSVRGTRIIEREPPTTKFDDDICQSNKTASLLTEPILWSKRFFPDKMAPMTALPDFGLNTDDIRYFKMDSIIRGKGPDRLKFLDLEVPERKPVATFKMPVAVVMDDEVPPSPREPMPHRSAGYGPAHQKRKLQIPDRSRSTSPMRAESPLQSYDKYAKYERHRTGDQHDNQTNVEMPGWCGLIWHLAEEKFTLIRIPQLAMEHSGTDLASPPHREVLPTRVHHIEHLRRWSLSGKSMPYISAAFNHLERLNDAQKPIRDITEEPINALGMVGWTPSSEPTKVPERKPVATFKMPVAVVLDDEVPPSPREPMPHRSAGYGPAHQKRKLQIPDRSRSTSPMRAESPLQSYDKYAKYERHRTGDQHDNQTNVEMPGWCDSTTRYGTQWNGSGFSSPQRSTTDARPPHRTPSLSPRIPVPIDRSIKGKDSSIKVPDLLRM